MEFLGVFASRTTGAGPSGWGNGASAGGSMGQKYRGAHAILEDRDWMGRRTAKRWRWP